MTLPVYLALVGAKEGNGKGNGPGRREDWPHGRMDRWDMHEEMGWGMGWGWLLLLGLLVLLLVAAAVVVAVLLLRRSSGPGGGTTGVAGAPGAGGTPSAAEQLLDERFARGEIDEQEYLHRRSILRAP